MQGSCRLNRGHGSGRAQPGLRHRRGCREQGTGAQVTETGKLRCGSRGAATAGALGTAAVELNQGNPGLEGGGSGSFRARWGGGKMWSGLLAIPSLVYIEAFRATEEPFCAFSLLPANLAILAFLQYKKEKFEISY